MEKLRKKMALAMEGASHVISACRTQKHEIYRLETDLSTLRVK
jgi:hypothetical protein